VQRKKFHVEVKPMLKGEKILLYIEPDGLTATRHDQIAAQDGRTTTQAGPTART
jgi:hypothetical protein